MSRSRVTDYVVGFAFRQGHVLLIRKARPAWQKGRLNGVGGHVEAGELPIEAMRREFFEETGVWTSLRDWRHFAVVQTEQSRVFMFAAHIDEVPAIPMRERDEPTVLVPIADVPQQFTVPNLAWLVPMALRAADLPVPAIVHETADYEAA